MAVAVTVSSSAAQAAQRSWATIVRGHAAPDTAETVMAAAPPGEEEPDVLASTPTATRQALQPGSRGSRKCFCRGEVLMMLGHYGWIAANQGIGHRDAWKNGGRIYVHRRDAQQTLVKGDIVAFYLYADSQGLGAEECRVEYRATASFGAEGIDVAPKVPVHSHMRAEAGTFVAELLDTSPQPVAAEQGCPYFERNLVASDVAAIRGGERQVWKDVKSLSNVMKTLAHALAVNGESFCDSGDEASLSSFGDGDDSDSYSEPDVEKSVALWNVGAALGLDVHDAAFESVPSKPLFSVAECDESTSAGTRSDSETGSMHGVSPPDLADCCDSPLLCLRRPPGLFSPVTGPVLPPPGLGFLLPPGLEPPPGLELPACVV